MRSKYRYKQMVVLPRREQRILKYRAVWVMFDQYHILLSRVLNSTSQQDRNKILEQANKIKKIAITIKRSRYPFCPYFWTDFVEYAYKQIFGKAEPLVGDIDKRIIHGIMQGRIAS